MIASEHQIVLTHAGVFTFGDADAGTQPLTIDPATALLVNPGDRVRVRHPAPGGHRSTVITLSSGLLKHATGMAVHDAIPDVPRFAARRVAMSPATLLQFQRLRPRWSPRQGSSTAGSHHACIDLGASHDVVEFVRGLLTAARTEPFAAGHRRGRRHRDASRRHEMVTESARLVLATTPGMPHPIHEVAAALRVSTFHLAHVFRARTGVSVHRYLLQLRMAIALTRLAEGEASLSRLALDLGFSSHSHFTAVFTRHFGASPMSIRAAISHEGSLRAS